MAYETIIVAFENSAEATGAVRDLKRIGVPAADIKRHPVDPASLAEVAAAPLDQPSGGLWTWLFGRDDVVDRQIQIYERALRRGGPIISVRVMEDEASRVKACLDSHGPLDLQETSARI